MGLRVVIGYIAQAALLAYWLWVIASTAPQLRKGTRDRHTRVRVLLIKTAGFVLTAIVVGVIPYWATASTAWWEVIVTVPVAAALAVVLRRLYRRTVAAPRHRLTLTRRAKALDLHRRPRGGGAPLHLRPDEMDAATGQLSTD